MVSVGEEERLYIPPPEPVALLFIKVALVILGEEERLYIPPPEFL